MNVLVAFSYFTGDLKGATVIEPEAVLLLAARGCWATRGMVRTKPIAAVVKLKLIEELL
jgi:hypothetical protein